MRTSLQTCFGTRSGSWLIHQPEMSSNASNARSASASDELDRLLFDTFAVLLCFLPPAPFAHAENNAEKKCGDRSISSFRAATQISMARSGTSCLARNTINAVYVTSFISEVWPLDRSRSRNTTSMSAFEQGRNDMAVKKLERM